MKGDVVFKSGRMYSTITQSAQDVLRTHMINV
jgi:hypothetical protein